MIQRKQTIFLLLSALAGIGLLFIPTYTVLLANSKLDVSLEPIVSNEVHSSTGHLAAVAINFVGLVLASLIMFLYSKRELQLKLCYVLIVLWLALTSMLTFCPFIEAAQGISFHNTYFGTAVGVVGILVSFLAARFIKKDIELLKSADRIR